MGRYDLIAPFEDDVDYQAFAPERYDASGGDPEAWRLFVRLTAPGQPIVAAIAGQLSTVPPDELPPNGIPVKIPRPEDGKLASADDQGLLTSPPATTPETTTLYLSPFEGEGALAFGDTLRGAGLGNEIRWLKYTNVDTESLRDLTLTVPRLGPLESMTDDEVFAVFLAGELTLAAGAGTSIGSVSATADGQIEFAVHTDVGYVDPVAMWKAINPLSLFAAIDTAWPFLTRSAARSAAVTSLFPMAVLHHARIAYGLTNTQWRALGATQKALYWESLRAKYGQGTASPYFFSREDMPNVFQLEALIEFYLAYPRPKQDEDRQGVPAGPSTSVDLTDASTTWHFVLLEPFADLLRSPAMIGPAYALNPFMIDGVPFGPDRFDAVLFLVHEGIPRRWHRWTTYTAHSWLKSPSEEQSSIVGNIAYSFKSRNASTTAAINYAFIVFDHLDGSGKEACPGRFYYDSQLPDDANGKVEVMVHVAYTTTETNPQDYSGSAGCLVSPSFMRLRDQMLGFRSPSPPAQDKLDALIGASLGKSADIFKSDLEVFESHPADSLIRAWNTAFEGKLWLVRPDESTKR